MPNLLVAGNSTNGGTAITTDTSGTLNIVTGSGSGSNAITIDTSQNVSIPKGVGGSPAFAAYYNGAGQSIVTNTFVKVQLNTEEFDTNSCFDSTTNYRFTPTVAGYYQLNGQIAFTAFVAGAQLAIFKNGAAFKNGANTASGAWATVSSVIYLNGSTDYVELYAAQTSGSTATLSATPLNNYFNGALIRGV